MYTTPFYEDKKKRYVQFLVTGNSDTAWKGTKGLVIFNKSDSLENNAANNFKAGTLLKETATYKIFYLHRF
jgi:hypothetical protein